MLGLAEKEFLNMLSSLTYSIGLGEAAGKVWGVLALVGRPLSQAEIASMTGYSVPVVNTTLSALENWGFVVRAGKRGRTKLYKASSTFVDMLENFLKNLLERRVSAIASFLRENIDSFKPEYRESALRLLKEYEKAKLLITLVIASLKKWKSSSEEEMVKELAGLGAPPI